MKIAVMGSGLVGKPMAIDLAKDDKYEIFSFDNNPEKFVGLADYSVKTKVCDLSNKKTIKQELTGFDLVINAVPGFMGFETLETIINQNKKIVDIAFYERDPFDLKKLAESKNVTVIVDAGVSPGLSNLLIGEAKERFDELTSIKIYVGGLPKEKDGLYNYKAVFSPTDVLEEYIRPARLVENGKEVIKPALSEVEEIDFDQVGKLEAFNSDGLRTLLTTINAPNMVEKTLRYPGHVERIEFLRESGFLNKSEVDVNGVNISPFYFSAQVLSKLWELTSDDKDVTVLRVELSGSIDGIDHIVKYDVFDEYDVKTKTHSMARTTGYVGTMCARILAEGLFDLPGIFPLELLGTNKTLTEYIKKGLEHRGIYIKEKKVALK